MKITSITYEQKKNLQNYESRTVSLSAIVDENETDADAINGIAKMVDYYLNLPERQIEYNKQKGLLTSEDEKVKTYAEKYVARFDALKAEIEG